MQTLPVGKYRRYYNHVHKRPVRNARKEVEERVQFMAQVVSIMFASVSFQLGFLGGVCQRKVCGPRDTNS